jgi:hypothetical protein
MIEQSRDAKEDTQQQKEIDLVVQKLLRASPNLTYLDMVPFYLGSHNITFSPVALKCLYLLRISLQTKKS